MVVAVDFEKSIVWINWIGTHRNYDRIDVTDVEHDRQVEADSQRGGLRQSAH